MNTRELWASGLTTVGAAAVLFGAIDPLEGSIVILVGSAFMALGAFVRATSRRDTLYRLIVFGLILIGVGAIWGLAEVGGIGGEGGQSWWWGLLMLPYLVGWVMAVLGPDSPRWLLWLGALVSAWYLVMPEFLLFRRGPRPPTLVPMIALGVVGLITLVGCFLRLRRPPALPRAARTEQPVGPSK